MNLQKRNIDRPFLFWLIHEFSIGEHVTEEELKPISNPEFYLWMGMLSAALLIYGVVFRLMA
jgi:hypothetical protein